MKREDCSAVVWGSLFVYFGVLRVWCYNEKKRDAQKNILFHVRFRGLRDSKPSEIC